MFKTTEYVNEFEVGDVVVSICSVLDEALDIEGSVTGVMRVMDVQPGKLLVKYFNESGTYNYGTVTPEEVVQAV
jgi:hypothetical protein